MAYFAPFIDATGFHMPSYIDIRNELITNAQGIFGSDIYLEIDSQDYQWISAVATMIHDSHLVAQAAYNNRGPSTATDTGLDIIVKINGIKRDKETFSTCPVVLSGIANTVVINGLIKDTHGVIWKITSPISLDNTGQVTALATCTIPGPIQASIGDLNKIETPTYGWSSVTNTVAATLGINRETDGHLRSRQSVSSAQPSRSILEGLKGEIAAVPGVTRFQVYENETNATDANGFPAHSVTCVVEGGADADIAAAIFRKKGPGPYSNGTTILTVNDKYGQPNTIRFYRPTYIQVDTVITLKRLPGYTTQTNTDIKNAVAAFNNSLALGDDLSVSSQWGAALSANNVPTKPLFSVTNVTVAKHGLSQGTVDIVTAFNEVIQGLVANVSITET